MLSPAEPGLLLFKRRGSLYLVSTIQACPTPHPEVTIIGSEIESTINKYRADLPKRK